MPGPACSRSQVTAWPLSRTLPPSAVEADVPRIRRAADGEHHFIGGMTLAIQKFHLQRMPFLFDRRDFLAENNLDAAPHHFRAHMAANVVVEAAQDFFAAMHGDFLCGVARGGGVISRGLANTRRDEPFR